MVQDALEGGTCFHSEKPPISPLSAHFDSRFGIGPHNGLEGVGSRIYENVDVLLNRLCYLKDTQCDRPGGPHIQFKALLAAINHHDKNFELSIANRLYGEEKYTFLQVRKNTFYAPPCVDTLLLDEQHRPHEIDSNESTSFY